MGVLFYFITRLHRKYLLQGTTFTWCGRRWRTNPRATKPSELKLELGQVIAVIEAWMPPLRDKIALKTVNQMTTLPKWLKNLAEKEKINYSVLQTGLKELLGVHDYQ
jgi:hypothetical protein